MDDPGALGARVRSWRIYRGRTLEAVAGLAGISKGYLSMIENGRRPLDSTRLRVALARALDISVTDLTGQPYPASDSRQKRAQATVPHIRLALLETTSGAREPGRTVEQAAADVTHLAQLRDRCEYDLLGDLAPDLMCDLAALAASAEADAWRLTALVAGPVSTMLRNLGHLDLAWIAAERGREAANRHEDPVYQAAAAYYSAKALIPAGALDTAAETSMAAAASVDDLRPDDDRARQVYVALHLNAAWANSCAGRKDATLAHLDEAAEVVRTVRGKGFADLIFGGGQVGETEVAICRTSVAVELGEPGLARTAAAGVDPFLVPSPARQTTYFADLGRALAADRRDEQALRALRRAEDLGPQRVRSSPSVRETVGNMLRRARRAAGGRELQLMASRLGVD